MYAPLYVRHMTRGGSNSLIVGAFIRREAASPTDLPVFILIILMRYIPVKVCIRGALFYLMIEIVMAYKTKLSQDAKAI